MAESKGHADGVSGNCSLKTMQLNDMKAGMQGLDKEAINKVIFEASKGTPYFVHQQKRQERIDKQIKDLLDEAQKLTRDQCREATAKMDALGAELEKTRNFDHSIVHIDMDAFYAAAEMKDNPELKSKPMAVGSNSMLSTSNYEARKYGVRAAMPGFIAKKLCPGLIIVGYNFDKYKKISQQVMNIVKDYDPHYSAASLDEVYFDLTSYIWKMHNGDLIVDEKLKNLNCDSEIDTDDSQNSNDDAVTSKFRKCHCNLSLSERDKHAYDIVEEIRNKILETTQLTASAGIASNTMLAKVCSDQNKPNGQYQILSDRAEVMKFVSTLSVKKVCGIGPVQGQLLNALGINSCSDLWDKRDLVHLLFSPMSAEFYIRVSLGLGSTVVKSDYVRKSIGVETTFRVIEKYEELLQKCEELCEEMVEDLKSHDLVGKVVVLKIKTVNFDTHTRNSTLATHTSDKSIILRAAKKLLDGEVKAVSPKPLKLRLMGIRMSNLLRKDQLSDRKQIKLNDFLLLKANSPSKKESITAASSSKVFICPICELKLSVNLRTFNEHVDHCLVNVEGGCASVTSTTLNTDTVTQQNRSCSNETTSENEGDLKSEKQVLVCPICAIEQKYNDPIQLNIHIDSCLSHVAIKELLSKDIRQEKNQSEKRKNSTKSQTGKKAKLNNKPTVRKISDFFQ